jgi:hypothetical protein
MDNWGKQSRTIQFGNPRAEQKHKTTGGKKLPQNALFSSPEVVGMRSVGNTTGQHARSCEHAKPESVCRSWQVR